MKIEISRERFQKAIGRTERVASRIATLPVLQCILIEVKGQTCTLRATNLDLGIEATIPSKVEEEGIVAIPAHVLSQVVSTLGSDEYVKLETSGPHLAIHSSAGRTLIKALPHEDFPNIPMITEGTRNSAPVAHFLEGVRSVSFACSQSAVKPELGSVYLYPDGDQACFVATDSFRLAEKKLPKQSLQGTGMLIPSRVIAEIIRICESVGGDMEVVSSNNQVAFFLGSDVYLTSRLIEGTFPDYRQIIPAEPTSTVTLLRADLAQAIKKANVFSQKSSQVHFSIDPKAKRFTVSAQNEDVGEVSEAIPAKVEGEALEINFNLRYVSDALPIIAADSITLAFSGLSRAMVMRVPSDPSFLYLVMPMNR